MQAGRTRVGMNVSEHVANMLWAWLMAVNKMAGPDNRKTAEIAASGSESAK